MHSLMQVKNVTDLTISTVTITDGKNGISVEYSSGHFSWISI